MRGFLLAQLLHPLDVEALADLGPNLLLGEASFRREAIEEFFPDLAFTWLDTELSSGEVCLIKRADLPGS